MKRLLVLGWIVGVGMVAMAVGLIAQQGGQGGQGGEGKTSGKGQGRGGGGGGFGPVQKPEKVKENLYLIRGAGGNTAVFITTNGVVLVDTKLANNGQAILDQVKSITDKAITHIINTHTHGDHTGSNPFFPARVEIVTQANTKTNMEKMDAFKDPMNRHGLPDRTFEDRMTLLSGKDAIDLFYFGPAHTNGDAFVVFRDLRTMHAGDVFAGKGQPFIDVSNGGSGLTFGETIGKAAAGIKDVDTVIPGHSALMKWQDFVDFGEFNRLYLDHARSALKAGSTAEQAMADLKLPEKFKDYNLQGGRGNNLKVIFEELQKK